LIRKEAIEVIAKEIGDQPIVSANGYVSRDLFKINDKASNFYMIGSMGLASSIGLGIALKNPNKRIIVFDGDGNILMNLGSLATIGSVKPKNLIHIIFDNSIHESTGGQPTISKKIEIADIAKVTGYKVFKTKNKKSLSEILSKIKTLSGPILILVKIEKSNNVSERVKISPVTIKKRFMNSIN